MTVTDTNTSAVSAQSASVAPYSSTLPDQPVADAGGDQAVNALQEVTLHGVGTQANGHTVTYAWTQTGGTAVTLSDATVTEPTFTAPASADTLTFSLIVTDTQSGIAGNGPNGNTSLASSVTIAVAPSTISGTITDPDSNPVQGASVKAFGPTDTSTPSFTATTAADGTYTLPVSPNTYDIEVVGPNGGNFFTKWYINASTRASATDVIVSDSDVSNVDVQLALGGQISGTVTNGASAPVAGVPVWLVAPSDVYVPSAIATTAADGTYAFHTLTPNSYKVAFVPSTASGYSTQWYNGAATRVVGGTARRRHGLRSLQHRRCSSRRFRRDQRNRDEARRDRRLRSDGSRFGPTDTYFPSATAVTAANGTYTIQGLATNNYQVYFVPASGQGLVTQWYNGAATRAAASAVAVTGSGTTSGINARLGGNGVISGKVTKAGGAAVAGIPVYLVLPTDVYLPSLTTTTAANGTYSFHGLPPNSYKVAFVPASGSGYSTQWYNGVTTRAAATAIAVNGNTVTNVNAVLVSTASFSHLF